MLKAHANPNSTSDLVVRVTGYSAFFSSLLPNTGNRPWTGAGPDKSQGLELTSVWLDDDSVVYMDARVMRGLPADKGR